MKKIKRTLVALVFAGITIYMMFGIIIPKVIESKTPGMEKMLIDNGYTNPELVKINSLYYQAEFKTDKGDVKVRFSKNGVFNIVY